MDYWFNINVEQSLQESLNIAKNIYQDVKAQVTDLGETVAVKLPPRQLDITEDSQFEPVLAEFLSNHGLSGLEIVSDQRTIRASVFASKIKDETIPEIPAELLRRSLSGEKDLISIQAVTAGELVRGLTPVYMDEGDIAHDVLIATMLIPRERLERMDVISKGLEGYRQLMLLKNPIKTSLLVMLLIVTLLIIFCAIWFGFYVADGLTGPIDKLVAATGRVADGELDFVIERESGDEMGTLVDSFNQMTRDLLAGKQQIEEGNKALRESYLELDQRRRYIEIVLQNVAAGVISVDADGRVTMINRFAEDLLQIKKEDVLLQDYRAILNPGGLKILDECLGELADSGKSSIQRPLRLTIGDQTFSLRVNFTKLEDEYRNQLGVVLVFDNLTELEKAQRMAAWREVARRIAHEVKNPLTPVQLSAQRLRKKYLDKLGGDGEVFDLCTKTIINQVDELKRLVSEFSNFARMPAVSKSMNSLPDMAREVMVLYQEAHKNLDISLNVIPGIPNFNFDFKQMKRVLINLLDNAVAVVPENGTIGVEIYMDEQQKQAFLEVKDNGPGVKDEDKLRLFEPYFSTKKTGTGLGLAIAMTIVADHGGYIRVRDNEPIGAKFIIELPLATG
jgi:two-component system nitrogen regulation sensor histidine kinase NtrY